MTNRFVVGAVAGLALALVTSVALAQATGTKETNKYKDWTTYEHRGAPGDICFATTQPRETEPTDIPRDEAYFYVSAWPKDGVKSEVSVKMGFAVQPESKVQVAVGNARFELFTKGDKAFVSDPNEELKLVNAMRRGSFMTVTGTSETGITTTDTYSLLGVSAALRAINSCN